MSDYFSKRRALTTACLAGALFAVGCKKEEPKPVGPTAVIAPLLDTQTLTRSVGAEPGPVQRSEGAAAMIAASTGTIEVRRLGQESYLPIRNGALHSGDQVRVAADASATIVFADTTTAEVAELSSLAIGSRSATADPASSAAVLSGVVRFSVAARVPGEGPYLVFTPAGVVATKGTVFAVGVAASGDARVGVESGSVEVASAASLAQPVTLGINSAIELHAAGSLGKKLAWTSDDWGAWRDGADAAHDVSALAIQHGNALVTLGTELAASHEVLLALGSEVAEFEAEAALAAAAGEPTKYRAALPGGAEAIDATFLAGLRTEWLTHAYVARALLASELYARHPKAVVWKNFGSNIDAAVLWPKRLEGAAVALLEPMRLAYYVHSARGRAHAQFVGLTLPDFYAGVAPVELPPARAKLKFEAYVPPSPAATSNAHGIWIASPTVGWHAQLRPVPAPLRAGRAFWSKPAKLRGRVLLGAAVQAQVPVRFEARGAIPRAQLKSGWKLALGEKIALGAPNLGAARTARGVRITGSAAAVLPAAPAAAAPAVAAKVAAKIHVEAPGLRQGAELTARIDSERATRELALEAARKAKRAEVRARRKAEAAEARAEQRARVRSEDESASSSVAASVEAAPELELEAPELRAPKLGAAASGSAKLSLGL